MTIPRWSRQQLGYLLDLATRSISADGGVPTPAAQIERLVGEYYERFFNWATQFFVHQGRQFEDARDCSQTLALKLLMRMEQGHGLARQNPCMWLIRVAMNVGHDFQRGQAWRRTTKNLADLDFASILPDPHPGPVLEAACKESQAQHLALLQERSRNFRNQLREILKPYPHLAQTLESALKFRRDTCKTASLRGLTRRTIQRHLSQAKRTVAAALKLSVEEVEELLETMVARPIAVSD